MAFIPEYKHDIFVSYAHIDNEPLVTGINWISQLVRYVGTGIAQRLGTSDELRVFFDTRDLSSGQDVDVLREEVRNSAIFLAVSSPSYVARDWPMRELATFAEQPDFSQRLFVAEMLPLELEEDYPEILARKKRVNFWHINQEVSRAAQTLDPQLDQKPYVKELIKLSTEMRDRLVEMRNRPPAPVAAGGPAISAPLAELNQDTTVADVESCGTVLLAQVTDELEWERDQVASFLRQMKVRVLPETDYPQGGAEFVDAFAADLESADLVIQLVGRAQGRRPPDLPQGYSRCQFDTAKHSGKSMQIWRHPEIDMSAELPPDQREMLEDSEVIVSGLESFKSEILTQLDRLRKPKRAAPQSIVYIGADRNDLEVARALASGLQSNQIPAAIPSFEGTSEEVRQELDEHIAEGDTLIFIHGSAPSKWVRSNLARMHRIAMTGDTQPAKVAVYLAPPREKPEVTLSLPYVEYIDSRENVQVEPLLTFLKGEE